MSLKRDRNWFGEDGGFVFYKAGHLDEGTRALGTTVKRNDYNYLPTYVHFGPMQRREG